MESVTGDLIELSQWGGGLKSLVRGIQERMNPPDLENKSKDNSIETFYSKGGKETCNGNRR